MGITTNGWDLVYNMRFEALNHDLQKQFAVEETQREQLRVAVAQALGGGLKAEFAAVVENRGSGYTNPPKFTASYLDGSAAVIQSITLRVQSLRLTALGTGYTNLPTVTIGGSSTSAATAVAVLDGISQIVVDNPGTDYTKPVVSITGGGSGAQAQAVVAGGAITSITMLQSGSGYVSAPTVTITEADSSSLGADATATAIVGLGLKLTSPGSGYTAPPTITINGGGGSGATATAVLELDDFTGPLPMAGATALVTIAPTAPDTATTTTPALAYATPRFASPGTPASGTNFQIVQGLLAIGLQSAVTECYGKLPSFDLPTVLQQALNGLTSGNRLTDLLRQGVSGVARAIWSLSNVNLPNEVLILRQWTIKSDAEIQAPAGRAVRDLVVQVFEDWLGLVRDPAGINKADVVKAEGLLTENEVLKTANRAEHAARCIQADVVFDHAQLPDQPAFFRQVSQLDISTPARYNALLETVLEAAVALLPGRYSHQLQGIGWDKDDSGSNRLDKVVLHTSAWQLTTGGAGDTLRMRVPVRGGYLLAGRQPLSFTPADKLYILLQLQLTWAAGGTSAVAATQEARLDPTSVQVLGVFAGNNVPLQLSARLQALLIGFIQTSINRKQASLITLPPVPASPIDFNYEYSHVLVGINVFDDTATKEDGGLRWMYPTTAAYAVADDARKADLSSSVFSVCCMTEGRPNHAAATAFVNAIAPGNDASILIGATVLCNNFLKPQLAKAFYKQRPVPGDDKTPLATPDDFEATSELAFVNKNPLYLIEGVFKDENGNRMSGYLPANAFSCVVGQERVAIALRDMEFRYARTKVLFSQEQAATFRLNTADKTNQFEVVLHQQSQSIVPQIAEASSGFWTWRNLGFLVGEMIFMGVSAYVLHCCTNRTSSKVQPDPAINSRKTDPIIDVSAFPLDASFDGVELQGLTPDSTPDIIKRLLDKKQSFNMKFADNKFSEKINIDSAKPELAERQFFELKTLAISDGKITIEVKVKRGRSSQEANPKVGDFIIFLSRNAMGDMVMENISCDSDWDPSDYQKACMDLYKKDINFYQKVIDELSNSRAPYGSKLLEIKEQPSRVPPQPLPPARPAPEEVQRLTTVAAREKFRWGELLVAGLELVLFGVADYYALLYESMKATELRYAIEHGGDNISGNVVNTTVAYLLNHMTWPAPPALLVTSFDLKDSIVIGLRRTDSVTGSVSTNNPAVIMPVLKDNDVESFMLSNLGGQAIRFTFLDSSKPAVNATQGTSVVVAAGANRVEKRLSDFGNIDMSRYKGILVQLDKSDIALADSQFCFDLTYNSTQPL